MWLLLPRARSVPCCRPSGSSRLGCVPCGVRVPTSLIVRFERLAYPVRVKVTTRVLPGRRSHRRSTPVVRVGAVRVASKLGGPKVTNDDGPENDSRTKLLQAEYCSRRPTCRKVGKADAEREGMDKRTVRAAGVRVRASKERYAEERSGRATSQQGLAATCKDPLTEARPKEAGGIWSGA